MKPQLRYFLIIVFACALTWAGNYQVIDDSLIYARYIRNALQGHGLVYNIGEHVNALTSPLYCYLLLAVAKVFGGKVLLASHIIFVATWLCACFTAERLIRFAGVLVAAYGYFYIVQGMETSLFLFMLALAVLFYRDQRWNWLPLVYALLVLTRFEGGLLALSLFTFQIYKKKMPSLSAWIPAAVVLVAYGSLNLYWYGHLLPSSAGAKFGQGMSGYWGRWPTAFLRIHGHLLRLWVFAPVLLAVFAARMQRKRWQSAPWQLPVALFLAGLLAFYVLFNLPDYPWYYAPFVFFALLYLCAITNWTTRKEMVFTGVAMLVCLSNAYILRASWKIHIPVFASDYERDYTQMDNWLQQHAPEGARIATPETGFIGWQLPNNYIIDTIGLTSPENAAHIAHREPGRWLAEDHADYVVVHQPAWPYETVVENAPEYIHLPVQFGRVTLYARAGLQR